MEVVNGGVSHGTLLEHRPFGILLRNSPIESSFLQISFVRQFSSSEAHVFILRRLAGF